MRLSKRLNIFAKITGVGILLLVPALVAFISGRPFIFPSLGPSAYNLVSNRINKNSARKVIGGHLTGLISGLISYKIIASGITLAHNYSLFSIDMLRIGLSGMVSVMLTTGLMSVTKTEHSPACATTLIIALGLLSTFSDCLMIMISIVLMYMVYKLLYGRSITREKK
jgi:hypothetical protein